MTEHDQISFTVSPYDDDAPRQESTASASRFSVTTAMPAAFWLISAAMAVLANFLLVYRIGFVSDVANGGDPSERLTFGFNGWGQSKILSNSAGVDLGSFGMGARWGWLFTGCAVLLVVAALWAVLRPQWGPWSIGPSELVLAALFGQLGTIVALVLSFAPARHQLSLQVDQLNTFSWGGCWPLELAAFGVGLLGWICYRYLGRRPVEPTAIPEGEEPTFPERENWFDEAMDHPGTPRDLGPSPW